MADLTAEERAALAAMRVGLVPVPVRVDNEVLVGVVTLDDLLKLVSVDNKIRSDKDALYDTPIAALAAAAVALGLVPEPSEQTPGHVVVPVEVPVRLEQDSTGNLQQAKRDYNKAVEAQKVNQIENTAFYALSACEEYHRLAEAAQQREAALIEAARGVVKEGNQVLQLLRCDEPLGLSVHWLQTKVDQLAALLPQGEQQAQQGEANADKSREDNGK